MACSGAMGSEGGPNSVSTQPQRSGPQGADRRGGDPSPPPGAKDQHGWLAGHRRLVGSVLLGLAGLGFAYYVLPRIVDLGPTLTRLRSGNPAWFALAVPLEGLSLASYVVLFRAVLAPSDARIGWRASYEIAMAGGGATKLLAAAGSGGVAVTVWALRGAGLSGDATAERLLALDILNYGVYMAALVIGGFGLWFGVFPGKAPIWLTLIPALFGLVVILCVVSMLWWAAPVERFMLRRAEGSHGRLAGWWAKGAKVPRALERGVRTSWQIVRGHDHTWLAAIPAWGFDIAVLWACFRAFGHSPNAAQIVVGYYVGTMGNVLPLPGGIGGVEGGMVGAFLGFGVNGGLAVLAVLGYRTISYWLPALPQGAAYIQLRARVRGWRAKRAEAAAGATAPPHHRSSARH